MMASERLQKPVLVLNASYEPINICAARRPGAVLKGSHRRKKSPSTRFIRRAPWSAAVVIRLLEYRRIPHQTRALSRKNILMRDRYTCQYCHRVMPSGELTLDHVIPRSRAGETAWENWWPAATLQQSQGKSHPRRAGINWRDCPGHSACTPAAT